MSSSSKSSTRSFTQEEKVTFNIQLRALLWKDLYILKLRRSFIGLLFEIAIPLACVGIIMNLQAVSSPNRYSRAMKYYPKDSRHQNAYTNPAMFGIRYILYTPATDYTHKVINRTFMGTNFEVIGYDTMEELEHAAKSLSKTYWIIFHSDGNAANLSYTLRFDNRDLREQTSLRYPFPPSPGPIQFYHGQSGIMSQLFLAHLAYNDIRKTTPILLNRFPYPRYLSNPQQGGAITSLPSFLVFGYTYFMIRFISKVIHEKQIRIREYLRMMGLSDWVYFTSMFLNGFVIVYVVSVMSTILLKMPVTNHDKAVLHYTNNFLLLFILLLYGACFLLFLIFLTTFFNTTETGGVICTIIWFLSLFFVTSFIDPAQQNKYQLVSRSTKLLVTLLSPNAGFYLCVKLINFREEAAVETRWSNLFVPALAGDNITLGSILLTMILSIAFYMFLIFYVDNVWPWQIGIPKSPTFIFKKSYWSAKQDPDTDMLVRPDIKGDLFEKLQGNEGDPTVVLAGVSKIFGDKQVLFNLDLELYSNQISVILGHNGAGKTTTMNILTGLFPPSSGKLFINGYNVVTNTKLARQNVGLCPQHNILFDELTVLEHLILFGMLKGSPDFRVNHEAAELINKFDLMDKRNVLSKELSGGMKRKLSMCNAMVGGSTVVIFDEPTAGMDPEVRRRIWTILQELRKDRTIILTTHYMEEADVLGDRITFLSHGTIKCSGSPLFLKKKFDTGYKLRVAKASNTAGVDPVMAITRKHLGPHTFLECNLTYEYCINLGFPHFTQMVSLFKELESKKPNLGIASLGMSVTTMEDVFLKVGEIAQAELDKAKGKVSTEDYKEFPSYTRVTGIILHCNQFYGLLRKRFDASKRQWWLPLLMIALPVAMTYFYCQAENLVASLIDEKVEFIQYSLPFLFEKSRGFLSFRPSSDAMPDCIKLAFRRSNVIVTPLPANSNITGFLLDIGEDDLSTYKEEWKVGATYRPRKFTMWWSGEAFHMEATALLIAQNAILTCSLGDEEASVTAYADPFPPNQETSPSRAIGSPAFALIMQSDLITRTTMATFMSLATTFITSSFIIFPISERVSKSKLIQLMTGVPKILFVMTNFFYDYCLHIICSACVIQTLLHINPNDVFTAFDDLPISIVVLFAVYGWAMIPFAYLLSYYPDKPSSGFSILQFLGIAFGVACIAFVTKMYMTLGGNPEIELINENVTMSLTMLRFVPNFSILWGLANIHLNGALKSICGNFSEFSGAFKMCNDSKIPLENYCCEKYNNDSVRYARQSPFSFDDITGIGNEVMSMFVTGVVLLLIIFAIEFQDKIRSALAKEQDKDELPSPNPSEDDDVISEAKLVADNILKRDTTGIALMAKHLTKTYPNGFVAVKGISFRVKAKECFGLLGVNGAGKTTTFGMLTGDIPMTTGNSYIGDINVKDNLQRYQSEIGYCPQFDPLIDSMTGRESLNLMAHLRGVPKSMLKDVVDLLVKITDIEEHADKRSDTYSGGNKRKLSIGMAILGGPQLVFLDEPTAGVDPEARRKIWNTLIKVQKELGSAMVLTSHSMEECEALCSRLCIMVSGTLRCIGSTQHIKNKYGNGFRVLIKLKQSAGDDMEAIVVRISEELDKMFPRECQLTSFHQCLVQYRISARSVVWSEVCERVHQLNKKFQFEDIVVSDTTLEDVFLSFAQTFNPLAKLPGVKKPGAASGSSSSSSV